MEVEMENSKNGGGGQGESGGKKGNGKWKTERGH